MHNLKLIKWFIFGVNVAALASIWALPWVKIDRVSHLIVLAILTVIAGLRPVRIRALGTELTATDPFVFCALAAFGPQAALLIAVAALAGAALGRTRRQAGIYAAFNVGCLVLSTSMAGMVFVGLGGEASAGLLALVLPLLASAAAYFVTNTCLAAVAIAMSKGAGFFRTWIHSCLWTLASFVTGVILSAGMLLLLEAVGSSGLALALPSVLTLAAFHRMHRTQVESTDMPTAAPA